MTISQLRKALEYFDENATVYVAGEPLTLVVSGSTPIENFVSLDYEDPDDAVAGNNEILWRVRDDGTICEVY